MINNLICPLAAVLYGKLLKSKLIIATFVLCVNSTIATAQHIALSCLNSDSIIAIPIVCMVDDEFEYYKIKVKNKNDYIDIPIVVNGKTAVGIKVSDFDLIEKADSVLLIVDYRSRFEETHVLFMLKIEKQQFLSAPIYRLFTSSNDRYRRILGLSKRKFECVIYDYKSYGSGYFCQRKLDKSEYEVVSFENRRRARNEKGWSFSLPLPYNNFYINPSCIR